MIETPWMQRAAAVGLAAALAMTAGCTRPGLEDEPVPSGAAAQVDTLTELRDRYDTDGDGFVSRTEAEGYHRRYFGELDDNNDGRLSRAELRPETPGVPDLETGFEELVGATEQGYVDHHMGRYDLSTDPSMGMMSTKDFDQMFGAPDFGDTLPDLMQ